MLRDRGIIRGARLDIDLAAIGRPVQTLIVIRIRPPSRVNIEGFHEWALQLPEVTAVFVTSGSEDFLLQLAVSSNDQLYAFVIDNPSARLEVSMFAHP